MTRPVCVSAASFDARAMPKSPSFAWFSPSTRMLLGLTSRCTIPALLAWASASAAWATMPAARVWGSGPSAATSSVSVRPSTYSMTSQ